jgi:hypothetical protein
MTLNLEFFYKEDLKTKQNIKIDILNIYKNLKTKFNIDLDFLDIRIHNSRNIFNKYINKDFSDTWLIGNVNEKNKIDIISKELIKKEKYHKPEEFNKLIKHELTHSFINKIIDYNLNFPFFINEGIADYLSYNDDILLKNKTLKLKFKDLYTNEDWNIAVEKQLPCYELSSNFIKFIQNKYSFYLILKLLEKSKTIKNYEDFTKIFKEVFNIEFEELEKDFLNSILI